MKEVISEKFVLGFGCYCEQVREWRVGGRGIKQNLEQCCCKDEILSRITSRDCLKILNVEKNNCYLSTGSGWSTLLIMMTMCDSGRETYTVFLISSSPV